MTLTLAHLYNFLTDLTAQIVVALAGVIVTKLCTKKNTPEQRHTDEK